MYSEILCQQFNALQLRKDFLSLFHKELLQLEWSEWNSIDPTQLSQLVLRTAEYPSLVPHSSLSVNDLQQHMEQLVSIDIHGFTRHIVSHAPWNLVFSSSSQLTGVQKSRFYADFVILLAQLVMLPTAGEEDNLTFLETVHKKLIPIMSNKNIRTYIAVNDFIGILKRCTELFNSQSRNLITEKHIDTTFALLQCIAKQEFENSVDRGTAPFMNDIYGYSGNINIKFEVSLNPELLEFHTSGKETLSDQTLVIDEGAQGEERAAYHLQNYVTFLFHSLSTAFHQQRSSVNEAKMNQQNKQNDILIDYLSTSKRSLLRWILDMLVIRMRSFGTVEEIERDSITMNILSQILQIFNYVSNEFEDLSNAFLKYLLDEKDLALPTLTAVMRW